MTERTIILHLHIPKTGGTTLNKYIFKHWSTDESYVAENRYLCSGVYYFPTGFFHEACAKIPSSMRRVLSRKDLRAVVGHFCFGIHRHINRPWAYITMLRNPLDRIISLYYHLSPQGAISPEEFLLNPTYRIFENDQTRRLAGIDLGAKRCNIQSLQRAKENLRQYFTVVGVTERFDETLVLLRLIFGWKEPLDYYLKNVNTLRPKASFPAAVIDTIKTQNALDFELYEYAKTAFDTAISTQDVGFQAELEHFRVLKNSIAKTKRRRKRRSSSHE